MGSRDFEVFKFGGLSTGNAESIKNVCQIIKAYHHRPLVVVFSAMGKTTRKLVEVITGLYNQNPEAKLLIAEIDHYFENVLIALDLKQDFKNGKLIIDLIEEFHSACNTRPPENSDQFFDSIIGYGELISSAIISAYLQSIGIINHWIDIRKIMITDNAYTRAEPLNEPTTLNIRKVFNSDIQTGIFVTQGYIGTDQTGAMTSLGFEGSDYSAAILANSLNATKLTVWKDVDGIMNIDPKFSNKAQIIPGISYEDLERITNAGAKIIHPKTIQPLKEKNIPLYVRSFINPDFQGSTISSNPTLVNLPMAAIKEDLVLVKAAYNKTIYKSPYDSEKEITDQLNKINDIFHFVFSNRICYILISTSNEKVLNKVKNIAIADQYEIIENVLMITLFFDKGKHKELINITDPLLLIEEKNKSVYLTKKL